MSVLMDKNQLFYLLTSDSGYGFLTTLVNLYLKTWSRKSIITVRSKRSTSNGTFVGEK